MSWCMIYHTLHVKYNKDDSNDNLKDQGSNIMF